ncbi:potassium transporter Kup [Salidesulfovibrio onnuriiensis]|uniref:potassium transporter Kup n=1 Tax=Salidesulfovibrio onnuriiensis TaxID=2583823 RepID=UPI0011CCB118|nr:KUP/HAK/KT family potassium transporter [Salidesulfovibrio onnuriiensis]
MAEKTTTQALALGALGIVFGDIGTSPLYTLKACFSGFHAVAATPANVTGVLSLVFWALAIVISLKYVSFIMEADNRGEGGIIALFSLLPETLRTERPWVVFAALFGAALLYGDGFITPAISVLSALEGLSVITTKADPYVVPLTCAVLAGLFLVQYHGTHRIGRIFGPVMLLWFASLGLLGILGITRNPDILKAVNPWHAVSFFLNNGLESTIVLGAVVLCVTGGEALYADMGHFGKRPIRLAWYGVAMPALLLNYFGQGALLAGSPEATASPLYALVPPGLLPAMVALSTCATIIASQAVISGVFSITRQAIQLGYLPRMHIRHTSEEAEGQIYCPEINWVMGVICVLLVIGFRTSENLAGAYGIAITTTMVITTALYALYLKSIRGWSTFAAFSLCGFFMIFDASLFTSNLAKLDGGGWIPLAVAGGITALMAAWTRGRRIVGQKLAQYRVPSEDIAALLAKDAIARTPGVAVFLTASPRLTPAILKHSLDLTGSLKKHVILLSFLVEPVPKVSTANRLVVKVLGDNLHRVIARYGYTQHPDARLVISELDTVGVPVNVNDCVFFLGRETLVVPRKHRLWKFLYRIMARNSMSPAQYFNIPPHRTIELGVQVEL